MSVTAQPTSPPFEQNVDVPTEPIYRLSVEQYHAIARAGILDEDAPVELLEGWLVQKMTKNPPHSVATRLVREALRRLIPSGWYADSQEPLTTVDSEPEPDIVVMRGGPRDYLDRHPVPADIALVVEVAESSLRRDRETKKRVYARAGIPIYWIVNLIDRQIEVYTEPASAADPPDYGQRRDYGVSDAIPVVIGGVDAGPLTVEEVLP